MIKRRLLNLLGAYSITALVLVVPGAANAKTVSNAPNVSNYTFTTIDAPNCGNAETELIGINNKGQIVGGCSYSFLYTSGTFMPIDFPYFPAGGATGGINNAGQMVGLFTNSTGTYGFLDTNGTFITIDDPDANVSNGNTATEAYGINNNGQIVGIYLGPGYWESFLDNNNSFTTIADPKAVFNPGPPGSNGIPFSGGGTFAVDINDSSQIVGYYFDSTGAFNGFIDTNGQFTTIDDPLAPGGTFGAGTIVSGINNLGEMVGSYYTSTGLHGFLYVNGTFLTIDYPGSKRAELNGINDAGQIVGSYEDDANLWHGFLATPEAVFAGTPSQPNCIGKSISAVAQQYGGLAHAAAALDYSSVSDLQSAVAAYCEE